MPTLNEKVFKVKDMKPGINAAPMHPRLPLFHIRKTGVINSLKNVKVNIT